MLLHKNNNEPFLENACCMNKKRGETTIEWFIEKNPSIGEYANYANRISSILYDINAYSSASRFYANINTKNHFPSISSAFQETTIYMGFIMYCNYRNLRPIPEILVPICGLEKPINGINSTVKELILQLNIENRNYTLGGATKKKKVTFKVSTPTPIQIQTPKLTSTNVSVNLITNNNILKEHTLTYLNKNSFNSKGILINNEEQQDIPIKNNPKIATLAKSLESYLNKLNIVKNDTDKNDVLKPQRDAVLNYLLVKIPTQKKIIIDFIKTMSSTVNTTKKMQKRQTSIYIDFLENIEKWKDGMDNISINLFYKNWIYYLTEVFPIIILNQVDYERITIPKYLDLSQYHQRDIQRFVAEWYADLRGFYGKETELENVLLPIKKECAAFIKLSNVTPTGEELGERMAHLLFVHYVLSIFEIYIQLTEENNTIIKPIPFNKPLVSHKKSFNYMDKNNKLTDIYDEEIEDILNMNNTTDNLNAATEKQYRQLTAANRGNIKVKRELIAQLLTVFLQMMNRQKKTINIVYQDIQDTIFKLKEREKNIITDRLKAMTEEARKVDTAFKNSKLGVWAKGAEKGFLTYEKGAYDEESEFRGFMNDVEDIELIPSASTKINKKNGIPDEEAGDLLMAGVRDENDAYNMQDYSDNFYNGDFEGEEADYPGDYDES